MKQFVYAKDKLIYDKFGREFLLKGVGLGGWMLPEGYMWGVYKYYERPRRFETLILEKTDQAYANYFWDTYYENFISEADFKLIKEKGFNSVRLPVNFRLLMEENEIDDTVVFKSKGFSMIDKVIDYCKQYDLYLILDLHAAPGGQTGANIDDSKYDKPELFTKSIYQNQTIALWTEIASRYKDETIIAAYDLLNEPLPNWHKDLFKELVPLYKRLIKAVREIDSNHMISIEGAHWATDFSMINEALDSNMILHFHKYWNAPSIESLDYILEKRDTLNLPIYMGEGGENDLYWYAAAFKLYDQLNISWNFWTYKKIDNNNSIISFKKPINWLTLFDQTANHNKEEAITLLDTFLEAVRFENSVLNQRVINHLFRQDHVSLPSPFYDYYGEGISFKVNQKSQSTFRERDGISIVYKDYSPYDPKFSRYSIEDITEDKYPYLLVHKDDFYVYTFHLSSLKPFQIIIETIDSSFDVIVNDDKPIKHDGAHDFVKLFQATQKTIQIKLRVINSGIIRNIHIKVID
jgi:hypothetical protein